MKKQNIFRWLQANSGIRQNSPEQNRSIHYLHTYVHPCVINHKPHIVYPRGLKNKAPALFEKLYQYYSKKGYALKEDQRTRNSNNQYKNKRRRWAPILLFTVSMFFENTANADVEIEITDSESLQQQQVELHLISNKNIRNQIQQKLGSKLPFNTEEFKINSSEVSHSLFQLLKSHYTKKDNDPEFIINDLHQMARYYSHFPEVITLLKTLRNKNWELSYNETNWVTTASGNSLNVEKAVISFNTRSAAQLKLNKSCKQNPICIASPADALLHELLHTHSMLVNTEDFLAQGGMGGIMYPYNHEYSVIDAERLLYANMSKRDKIKRPQRREHTGRLVKANCPTCIN